MSPTDRPLDSILEHLEGVRRSGSGWTARCPAHDDRHASLSVAEGEDGRVLLNCHAGCRAEQVVAAVEMTMGDLFPASDERAGAARPPVPRATVQPPRPVPTVAAAGGCTLDAYARAKGLDVGFLADLGITELRRDGATRLRVPYRDTAGETVAVRYRLALAGADRFRWQTKAKPIPYGLWRLDDARTAGYLTLVEGESDCHTLWQAGEPALGLPGAATWKEEWAADLDGIPLLYVVVEPDAGGEATRRWVDDSALRERVRFVELGDAKDPSGLYLRDPARFRELWAAALEAAVPWVDPAEVGAQKTRAAAWEGCREIAVQPDILGVFGRAVTRSGFAGDVRVPKLLFLALVSRMLGRPVSVAVKGPSSGGKSFAVEQTLRFFPGSAYYALTAMSEHALAYSTEPIAHRFLVLYEAAGLGSDFATYLIRSLLSEGRLDYETVERSPKGGMRARHIQRQGPTGLILTTTANQLHPENETRLLSVTVDDTPEQTRAVLIKLASDDAEPLDTAPWLALHEWLRLSERRVVIPYVMSLALAIPIRSAVRMRRDFTKVTTLIEAHAILHQASRGRDEEGRIVAELADYAAVQGLAADLVAEAGEASVPGPVRETVLAVRDLLTDGGGGVMVRELARALGLDKSSASRRAKSAVDLGYLQNLEDKKGKPARLILGDPLPEDTPVLPDAATLEAAWRGCTVAPDTEGREDEFATFEVVPDGALPVEEPIDVWADWGTIG